MRNWMGRILGSALAGQVLAATVATTPLRADPPFARGPERVLFTWSGIVDRELWLTMRGGELREGGMERWLPSRTRVLSPLPYGRGLVLVRVDGGRGYVEVMDQPGPWNDYAVTIRILDPRGGATGYRLTAFWDDGGRGPNRWHPLWDPRWDLPRWDPRWSDPRWLDPRWSAPRWDDRRWESRRGDDRRWDDRRGDDRRWDDRRGDDRRGDDRRWDDRRGDDRDRREPDRREEEPDRRPEAPRRAQPRERPEERRPPEERPLDGRVPRPLVLTPPDTLRDGS